MSFYWVEGGSVKLLGHAGTITFGVRRQSEAATALWIGEEDE